MAIDYGLKGQAAIVTGSTSGIGHALARSLAQQGVDVVLNGLGDPVKIEAGRAALAAETGVRVHYHAADMTRPVEIAEMVRFTHAEFGRLDILVNNAGVALGPLFGSNACTASQDLLRQTFDVNFFAVIGLTQALLPLIRKAPAGRIVNLSSILGSLGVHQMPDSPIAQAKELAYNASKTALNAFTVHLADALKDTPIKVNSAHPGWVKTDMGGAEAPMEVSEGGKTSVQLATLPADGPSGGFFHLGEPLPW